MNQRSHSSLALAVAILASTACDRQPAGPEVQPENTGALRVTVQRDTSLRADRPFAAAPGVRVSVFRLGDTLALRQVTTNSLGLATFVGLAPGQYVVTPSLRPLSTFTGNSADTITITANDTSTVLAGPFQTRLGARVSGFAASQVTTQQGLVTTRFPGVQLAILRETGVGTNVFLPVTTVTTDATGAFDVPLAPGPGRVQIIFNSGQIPGFPNDTLFLGGSGTSVISNRGNLTATSTAVILPDANVTQNLIFNFNTRITGEIFRDVNGNGLRDTGEGLAKGDTVFVQLRDATGQRVIAPVVRVIGNPPATGPLVPGTYTFSSLQGGSYTVVLDLAASRFAAPGGTVRVTSVPVTLPTSLAAVSGTPAAAQPVRVNFPIVSTP